MARLTRLSGALLLASKGAFYLIGETKEPCDFLANGFQTPPELESGGVAFRALCGVGPKSHAEAALLLPLEGEACAKLLAQRLLIERNASVSERLWRLSFGLSEPDQEPEGQLDAAWLVEVPEVVWGAVRDSVLRCV